MNRRGFFGWLACLLCVPNMRQRKKPRVVIEVRGGWISELYTDADLEVLVVHSDCKPAWGDGEWCYVAECSIAHETAMSSRLRAAVESFLKYRPMRMKRTRPRLDT